MDAPLGQILEPLIVGEWTGVGGVDLEFWSRVVDGYGGSLRGFEEDAFLSGGGEKEVGEWKLLDCGGDFFGFVVVVVVDVECLLES